MGPMADVGASLVTLVPSFSSAGMEVAQVNASQEVGTIQSIESFSPPFTASAVVEGSISNGHTFGFAISSANGSIGVLIYGNLNDTNCSHLGNCGDPNVCGTSANPAIPPNQCYYGLDAKVGRGTGSWSHTAKLYLTPSVNVYYTLQISVDASGNAQYSVSQGGQTLGASTSQVGTGPYYLIMEQAEGAPVAKPGPNQAYWLSISVTPLSTTFSTTTSLPGPTTSSIPTVDWIILVLVIIFFVIILLLWLRRRNLTVEVQDSKSLSPILEAPVTADGPEKLAGYTGKGGRITFKSVDKGDYTIKASAPGYAPSVPVKVSVKKTTEVVLGLERTAPESQPGQEVGPSPEVPGPSRSVEARATAEVANISPPSASVEQQPQPEAIRPVSQAAPPQTTQPAAAPARDEEQEPDLGLGGGRIAEIIRTFREKGATSPETALTAQELGLSRLFVRIMKRRQGRTRIFMEINGKYYLDEKALQEMK